MPSSVEDKDYVRGNAGNNDVRATNDKDGSYLQTGAGQDILRGGRYDDVLDGGAGDDQYYGGLGADQFRFFGNQIEGSSDTDRVYDLKFSEGDRLVFGKYESGTFIDDEGENAYTDGTAATISSIEGLANAVNNSGRISAERRGTTDTLIVSITIGDKVHEIQLTGTYAAFVAAGGTIGPDVISA